MRRALIAALILLPLPALGQTYTTAELQALAAQDAQQYGVPVQLFLDQIQAESNWNPDASNAQSGATGIAEFLASTAADPGYGIAPFDPTDPVASLQAAAQYDAALYAANGDNWVAALTAYSGGLTPANPADYGTVFADAEAADDGTTTVAGQQPGITVTTDPATGTGTIASAAAAAGITGTATASVSDASSPFSFLYNEYTTKISGPLQSQLAAVQGMAAGPLIALIALSWMVLGVGVWGGRVDFGFMVNRTIRMALVAAMSGIASTWYQQLVVTTFNDLPAWITQQMLGGAGGNPASGLDAALHSFTSAIPAVNWNLPWGVPSAVGEIGLIAIASLFMFGSLIVAFIVFMVTQILAGILIVIGPIVLPFALFDRTLGWVDRWLSSLMGKMLTFLAASIVVSLMLGVIQDAFRSLPSTSQATAGVYQLLGVGAIGVVLAVAMASLPFVMGHIAAASGLPKMDYASRALAAAGNVAAGTAARGVRGALG